MSERESFDQAGEMRRVGDALQSEASRLAEWVHDECSDDLPYEVAMSLVAVKRLVEAWTEVCRIPPLPRSF